jgi:hypothetical protein
MGAVQILTGREVPREHRSSGNGARFDLHVIFTNLRGTRATIEAAVRLARDLGARITVLVAQVVPYPLPLDEPPVALEFTARALRGILSPLDVETSVAVYLCRDPRQTILDVLAPQSVVMIGAKSGWFAREQRLAAAIRRKGHRVIAVETQK